MKYSNWFEYREIGAEKDEWQQVHVLTTFDTDYLSSESWKTIKTRIKEELPNCDLRTLSLHCSGPVQPDRIKKGVYVSTH